MTAVVGLVVGASPSAAFTDFLVQLSAYADVSADAASTSADALMLFDPTPQQTAKAGGLAVPRAVWSESGVVGADVQALGMLVSPGTGGVTFPVPGVRACAVLAIPPFMRRRWRLRGNLDPGLVCRQPAGGRRGGLSDETAMAAVLVADMDSIAIALASGAPVVTTSATALKVGARHGHELLVADDEAGVEAAIAAILADDGVAAALGRRGRRLAEQRLDQGHAVAAVAHALGLATPVADAESLALGRRLGDLWTPPTAAVVTRMARSLP